MGRSLVRSQLVPLGFFNDIKFFRSHLGTRVDSASNRNEYQEHFLGVKVAGAFGPKMDEVTGKWRRSHGGGA